MRRLSIRKNAFIHNDLHVGRRSCIMAPDRLEIGRGVKIGTDTWIAVNGVIEDGVLISSYVGIIGKYDHEVGIVGQRPGTAPWTFAGTSPRDARHSVHIERDAWLGDNSTILSGVRIDRNAVIAASAVVTNEPILRQHNQRPMPEIEEVGNHPHKPNSPQRENAANPCASRSTRADNQPRAYDG